MNNYQTWLETPNLIRVLLVQVQYYDTSDSTTKTKYLSTHNVTVDGNAYLPIIKSNFTINEEISINYSASISYGDLQLANNNGEYDIWLNTTLVWVNKPINVYIGSLPQPGTTSVIGDFQQIFSGVVSDIDSKDRTTLNLKVRDKLEKLNTSVSDSLLGNYWHGSVLADNSTVYQNQYKNTLKPVVYGEVFNITPLLTDPSMLEYMVNDSAVSQIIEVRDNGVPVSWTTSGTTTIPAGSFQLRQSPVGTVTCSVKGTTQSMDPVTGTISSTYVNSAAKVILAILANRGLTLSTSELDLGSGGSFNTLGTQLVGVYLTDRQNVLQVCQDIAKSCGLILTTTRLGVVKLVDMSIPTSASVSITEKDILLNTLTLSQKLDVTAGFKLGYAKNYTVQAVTTVAAAVRQEDKDSFATEWLEATAYDNTVKSNYSVTKEPDLESTYLIDLTEATAVAQKKLDLFKVQRKIFNMTCTAKHLSVQVGDAVQLTSARFGLNSGVYGRVISTNPDWLAGKIQIGVLV